MRHGIHWISSLILGAALLTAATPASGAQHHARLAGDLERFIQDSFEKTPEDRHEVDQSIYAIVRNAARAEKLHNVLAP